MVGSSQLQFFARNRGAIFWQLQFICWGATIPVAILVAANYRLSPDLSVAVGFWRAILGLVVTSFLLRPLLRNLRTRKAPLLAVCAMLLVCSAVVALAEALVTRELVRIAVADLEIASVYLAASTATRTILYAVWCLLYLGIHYWFDTRDTQLRLARLEAENRAAELMQLRAQMNPHFLFNALNSIQAEARAPDRVLALTQSLAEYLRFFLYQSDDAQRLGKELDAIDHYLRVEGIRFEERFAYTIVADERARRCRVPGAMVQPLVENALKYGHRTSPPPLRLHLRAEVKADCLIVEVANSGKWVEADPAREGGIGLSNLRRRLELLFEKAASLDVAEDDEYVRVLLRLPAEPTEAVLA